MPATRLEQFGGMLPAWDDRLLPADQAAAAVNTYLFAGSLQGWRQPKLLRTLTNSAAKFAYRVPTTVSAVAGAFLAFLANANEGDVVVLGEESYRITATVTGAYDVLRGASAVATATNLFKAFTLTGVSGTTYGNGTCVNPQIDAVKSTQGTHDFGGGPIPVLSMVAPAFGAAYNTTVVTESTVHVRLSWLFDQVALTDRTTTFTGGANQTADNSISGASTWLEFVDPDTNIVRSPVVDDSFQRYYFASPSLPPQYNTKDRIATGLPPFLLGVPAPGCAPGITATGGGNQAQVGFPTSSTLAAQFWGGGPPAGAVVLVPIVPNGAMTLQSVTMIAATNNGTGRFTGVLYSDNNGSPGILINVGDQQTAIFTGSPLTSLFANPTGLLAGVKFWIGFSIDSATNLQLADLTGQGAVFQNLYNNGPPIVAPAASLGQGTFQISGNTITSAVLEARAYVYTWQTAYGEEGPPSPPTLVDSWSNAAWTVALFTPPPTDMGTTRNITLTNIYRAITGTSGTTTYFFVTQIPVAQAQFVDTVDDSIVALNVQLQSTLWAPPPVNLQGMHAMPNGMTVGFVGNELWFAEQYRPHAWPPSYVLTTEFPIVGIGVVGQSVVACTSSHPAIATGLQPATMSLNKVKMPEPCLSRGSILSASDGVYYTSLNGLILVNAGGGASNVTQQWITRERWRALTPSKNIRVVPLSSAYFAFGTTSGADVSVAQQGFTVDLAADDAKSFTIWPQAGGHRIGFGSLTSPNGFNIDNVMQDEWSGTVLLIQNNGVYYYDFADQAPTIVPYRWKSKKFQEKSKHSFEAMRIRFDIPPGAPPQNAVRSVNDPQPVYPNVAGQYGIVRVYADDVLHTTREIRKSGELLRLKSGVKADTWQVEVEGIVNVKNVIFATSVRELQTV